MVLQMKIFEIDKRYQQNYKQTCQRQSEERKKNKKNMKKK